MKNVDPSHDFSHVLRVYRIALEIAREYEGYVDIEVLKLSALLHDIARGKEDMDRTGKICHAMEGAREAEKILKELGYPEEKIEKIKHCILAHRFKTGVKPETLEAKILFDADKLDVLGAIGIARMFMIAGKHNQKLEMVEDLEKYKKENMYCGRIKDLSKHSPFIEFELKIKRIPERLYTKKAREIAKERIKFMEEFMKRLSEELLCTNNK